MNRDLTSLRDLPDPPEKLDSLDQEVPQAPLDPLDLPDTVELKDLRVPEEDVVPKEMVVPRVHVDPRVTPACVEHQEPLGVTVLTATLAKLELTDVTEPGETLEAWDSMEF